MNRIGRCALVRIAAVAVIGCALLAGCSTSTPQYRAGSITQPNIVFVLTDDLSTDLVKFMPHVEALAEQGTLLSHYFVVDSLCCPSRAAIFTGQYPHDNGVFTNERLDGGYYSYNTHADARKSFAVSLQRAGYRTAMMGKYLNGYEPSDPIPPGWDEWDVTGAGYHEFDYELNQDGLNVSYGSSPRDYLTDVLSQRAGHFIDESAHERSPFALEVATFAPHRPATPAPRDLHSYSTTTAPHGPTWDRPPTDAPAWLRGFPPLSHHDVKVINRVYRKRIESAQAVDDMIGHLEQRLRVDHLLKSTYFVFSSDNGFHTGQYGLLPGKQTAFDTDIRVPLIVTGPGVPKDRTVDAMASSVDLAPTFEQIGHAPSVDRADGTSLLSLWHGAPTPPDWQRAVLIEHHGPDFDRHDPDRQPTRAGDPPTYEAIRTHDAAYVEYRDGGREYYNLTSDPYELHNTVSTAPASTIDALHRTLQAMAHCHGTQQCQAAARTP